MIYSLELIGLENQLVLALGDKSELLEFQEELVLDEDVVVELEQTELKEYPVVVVCDAEVPGDTFSYLSMEAFFKRCDETIVPDSYSASFYFYFFDESFFYNPVDECWMEAVPVDKSFLESYNVHRNAEFLWDKALAAMVTAYNLEGLHVLFDKYIESDDEERKQKLAEDGYLSLLYTMLYDYACSKLTDSGILNLTVVADRAAKLLNKSLWGIKAEAYSCLMDWYKADNKKQALSCGKKAIDGYSKELLEPNTVDVQLDYVQKLAKTHIDMLELEPKNRQKHFAEALKQMKTAVQLDPVEADWATYLELLYTHDTRLTKATDEYESVEVMELQQQFKTLAASEPGHVVFIALAYYEFIKRNTYAGAPVPFVALRQYTHWLDETAQVNYDPLTRMQQLQVGEMLQQEGVRLKRAVLLEAALRLYEGMWSEDEVTLSIFYSVGCCENLADLMIEVGDTERAHSYLEKAWHVYRTQLSEMEDNYSFLVNYAEFLKRLFESRFLENKPTIHDIGYIAKMGDEVGKGYNTTCTFLRVWVALMEDREEEVIQLLIRALLLHELCIQDSIERLDETIDKERHALVSGFLESTLVFMHSVADEYYFNPQYKWNEVVEMNPNELITAWEKLKTAIGSRSNLSPSDDTELL